MVDVHTQKQRSRNMSAIKGSGNRSTELAFLKLLRKEKITGWRRHSRHLIGRPDFIFPRKKLAVFLDGCFWHGCPIHGTQAKANAAFWHEKIEANKRRDMDTNRQLQENGWLVIRAWEHENPQEVAKRIDKVVMDRRGAP